MQFEELGEDYLNTLMQADSGGVSKLDIEQKLKEKEFVE